MQTRALLLSISDIDLLIDLLIFKLLCFNVCILTYTNIVCIANVKIYKSDIINERK
jgi:hypothetical protein